MKKITFILLLCTGSFAAKAQIPQPDPDTTTKHFLIVVSIKNLQEISSGNIAIQKAQNPDVKAFGQMMVKAHGASEQKLLQLIKVKNMALPAAATGAINPDLMLLNVAGSKFDPLYVHNMISGHQNTVEVFQNYATAGKDPIVKVYAQEMLPVLKHHLDMIKAISDELKSAGK